MSRGRNLLPPLLSALLGIALYAVSIGGTYIYDDLRLLIDDPRVHDAALWGHFWTQSYNGSIDTPYRPLVSMTYAIQWAIHGDQPWAFHLVNVLLYGAVCALVAAFAQRLLQSSAAGFVAGFLFAAHPIHVEAVANIAGRPELMCAAGMFGALLLYLRPLTIARASAIVGCFIFALLSKEQGMLLPILLLILDRAMRWHSPPEPAERPPRLGLAVAVGVLLVGYLIFRQTTLPLNWDRSQMDWTVNPLIPCDFNPHGGAVGRDAWLMPLVLLGRYVALLAAPVRLSIDYGATVIGWHARLSDPYLWMGIAACIAWVMTFIVSVRRRSVAGVICLCGFALAYAMVGNIVSYIGTNFAERLMFIPSAFLLVLIAAGLARLPARGVAAVVAVLVALGGWRTVSYAARWNDPYTFYAISLSEQPESLRLHMLAAQQAVGRGQFERSDAILADARQRWPESAEVWLYSGIMAIQQQNWDAAQQFIARAHQLQPSARTFTWQQELIRRRAATAPAAP
jgi:hypothetical protein